MYPILLTTLLIAFLIYGSLAGAVFFGQGRLIFGKPTRVRPVSPGNQDVEHVTEALWLEVSPGISLEGWVSRPVGISRGAIIYFGGRNENTQWTPGMGSHLGPWTIYSFNPRSFGKSQGRPSEVHAKDDALKVMQMVQYMEQEQNRDPQQPVIVIGRSLGTAIAIHVARHCLVDRLILLSPFDSLESVLMTKKVLTPLRWTLRQTFDCMEDVHFVSSKTLVVMSEHDNRIPHEHSVMLASNLINLDRMAVVLKSNHATLPRRPATQKLISEFINKPF